MPASSKCFASRQRTNWNGGRGQSLTLHSIRGLIVSRYGSDVQRELDRTRDQEAHRFALLNGWQFTNRNFSYEVLSNGTRRGITRDFFHDPSHLGDHPLFFSADRRPVAIVCQPYHAPDVDTRLTEITRRWNLKSHQPPATFSSFYYPGACRFIVLTRPEINEVHWLESQMDAFGLFSIHDSEWRGNSPSNDPAECAQ